MLLVIVDKIMFRECVNYIVLYLYIIGFSLSKNVLGPIVIIVIQFGLHDLSEGFVVV